MRWACSREFVVSLTASPSRQFLAIITKALLARQRAHNFGNIEIKHERRSHKLCRCFGRCKTMDMRCREIMQVQNGLLWGIQIIDDMPLVDAICFAPNG